jgi:glucose/arabinose dehydrogenase
MPTSLPRAALPFYLAAAIGVAAPTPGRPVDAPEKTANARPPAPEWVKLVDQGGDPRLRGYQAPEGVKVEIVAEGPAVAGPVALAFADDGTPYVIEWRPSPEPPAKTETLTYKDGTRRTVTTMAKRNRDAIKVLRDSAGKGVYDEAKVVLEEDFPSAILLHDGWLYVAGQGTVRRYKPSKPGGLYDVREVVARGFDGLPRGVSGLALGNDGLLYVAAGEGDHVVEGSDGSRATVLKSGAVFRCRPDGSRVEVYALGLRHPYGNPAFDTDGNLFCADDGDVGGPKGGGCRLLHVAEGCDFGWRSGAAAGGRPGRMPPVLNTGVGEPAGLMVYGDTRFPERLRGLLYQPDPARRVVRAYRLERDRATFAAAEAFDFLRSDDPLFRPCQAVTGPDGAVYVVDRRSETSGTWRQGRIYRLTWGGAADEPALPPRGKDGGADLSKLDDAGLAKSLAADDAGERAQALRELERRGAKGRGAAVRVLRDGDAPTAARVAALGVLQLAWDAEVEDEFLRTLQGGDADLRRLAADGLGLHARRGSETVHDALLKSLGDNDPAVRRAVALAVGRVGAGGAPDALVNALAFDDGRDAYVRDGLLRAIEQLGKRGVGRLVELADSGVAKNTDKVVEAFAALRTRAAADAIPTLLENPHLNIEQRAALLRSYGNYRLDPPVSVLPALNYLRKHADEAAAVKLAGLEMLSAAGALGGGEGRAWLRSLLEERDPALLRAAVRALGTTAEGARQVGRLFLDGKLPREIRPEVAAALRNHADLAGMLEEVERPDRN